MTDKNTNLPVIDWNLSSQLTDNSGDFLRELLAMFAKQAPEMQILMNRAFDNKQKADLIDILHKLQGSCVYCGLLKLKVAISELSKAAHLETFNPELRNKVNAEILAVINEIKNKNIV